MEAKKDAETKLLEVLDTYDELRKAYDELEQTSKSNENGKINAEEDILEYKSQYESLQAEGQELYKAYDRKCIMLKQLGEQLEESKKDVAAKTLALSTTDAELKATTHERDELREKVHAQTDSIAQHEADYLSLKDEYNRAQNRIEKLVRFLLVSQPCALHIRCTDCVYARAQEMAMVTHSQSLGSAPAAAPPAAVIAAPEQPASDLVDASLLESLLEGVRTLEDTMTQLQSLAHKSALQSAAPAGCALGSPGVREEDEVRAQTKQSIAVLFVAGSICGCAVC